MTNLTHISFLYIYFNSLHVSCAGQKGTFQPVHETVTDTEWHIPEVVLIQLILLMMTMGLLEIHRELK